MLQNKIRMILKYVCFDKEHLLRLKIKKQK